MTTTTATPQDAIAYLKAREWTDKRIADEVGVSQPCISRLATGKRSDPLFSLGKKLIDLAVREGLSE